MGGILPTLLTFQPHNLIKEVEDIKFINIKPSLWCENREYCMVYIPSKTVVAAKLCKMNWTETSTTAWVKFFICAKLYFPDRRNIGEYFNLKGNIKGHIPLLHKRRDGKGDLCLNHLRGEATIECWPGTIFSLQLTLITETATEEITDPAPY